MQSKLHLVVRKYLVSNISMKVNRSHPCFWIHLGLKYPRLTKFTQKFDPNARILKIFMDSLDTSHLFTYRLSIRILQVLSTQNLQNSCRHTVVEWYFFHSSCLVFFTDSQYLVVIFNLTSVKKCVKKRKSIAITEIIF